MYFFFTKSFYITIWRFSTHQYSHFFSAAPNLPMSAPSAPLLRQVSEDTLKITQELVYLKHGVEHVLIRIQDHREPCGQVPSEDHAAQLLQQYVCADNRVVCVIELIDCDNKRPDVCACLDVLKQHGQYLAGHLKCFVAVGCNLGCLPDLLQQWPNLPFLDVFDCSVESAHAVANYVRQFPNDLVGLSLPSRLSMEPIVDAEDEGSFPKLIRLDGYREPTHVHSLDHRTFWFVDEDEDRPANVGFTAYACSYLIHEAQ